MRNTFAFLALVAALVVPPRLPVARLVSHKARLREVLPGPLRVRLNISNARMRFNDGVIGLSIIADGACRLENGILPDTPNESFAVADVVVVLTPSTSPQGDVEVRVDTDARAGWEVDQPRLDALWLRRPPCAHGAHACAAEPSSPSRRRRLWRPGLARRPARTC